MIELLERARRGWVIEGDCLESLRGIPPEVADAFVTDPPYCSGGYSETGKRSSKGMTESAAAGRSEWFTGDNMGTAGLVWLLRGMAAEAGRILKPGGSLLVFCDWRMVAHLGPALESVGLSLKGLLVWDKGSAGMGTGFRPQPEMVLHLTKGVGCYYSHRGSNVISCSRVAPGRKAHPTEKPTPLIRNLIEVVTPDDGLVVDPFAGSGATGVASLELGRSWIGCEVMPRFARVIRERLDGVEPGDAVGQTALFSDPKEAPCAR